MSDAVVITFERPAPLLNLNDHAAIESFIVKHLELA